MHPWERVSEIQSIKGTVVIASEMHAVNVFRHIAQPNALCQHLLDCMLYLTDNLCDVGTFPNILHKQLRLYECVYM